MKCVGRDGVLAAPGGGRADLAEALDAVLGDDRTRTKVDASCTTRAPLTFKAGFARALTVVVSTDAISGSAASVTDVGQDARTRPRPPPRSPPAPARRTPPSPRSACRCSRRAPPNARLGDDEARRRVRAGPPGEGVARSDRERAPAQGRAPPTSRRRRRDRCRRRGRRSARSRRRCRARAMPPSTAVMHAAALPPCAFSTKSAAHAGVGGRRQQVAEDQLEGRPRRAKRSAEGEMMVGGAVRKGRGEQDRRRAGCLGGGLGDRAVAIGRRCPSRDAGRAARWCRPG